MTGILQNYLPLVVFIGVAALIGLVLLIAPFIVAFQPANAHSSQPVAVDYPNSLNLPPGATAKLADRPPPSTRAATISQSERATAVSRKVAPNPAIPRSNSGRMLSTMTGSIRKDQNR